MAERLNDVTLENLEDYSNTILRKTHCITLWDRQRRALDFIGMDKQMFMGLARTDPWSDPNDPDISDTFPPMPDERATELSQLIGMQRIQWKKFAKPYLSPTTEQKNAPGVVYYKGLYYQTFEDTQAALDAGCTSVMVLMTSDRDYYFPIGVSYRQVGLFVQVDDSRLYMDNAEYEALPAAKKGHLICIENFSPITRQADQEEKHFILIDF